MRRRFLPFFAVVTGIFIAVYAYFGARLAQGPAGWLVLAVPFLSVWSMPLLLWREEARDFGSWVVPYQWFSFFSMGYLSFLLVLSLTRDVLILATLGDVGAMLVIFGALFVTLVGSAVAFLGPRIKRVDILVEGLDLSLEGMTIAQISDLHVGPTIRRPFVERVVGRTNALNADVVALTGDIVDGPSSDLLLHASPLANLRPKGRILFVPGNHEYYWNVLEWEKIFAGFGIEVLHNRHLMIPHKESQVAFAGVGDPAARYRGPGTGPDLKTASAGIPAGAIKILLAHQPQIAKEAADDGYHLQLSGHTHAGQFFPWTIVVRFFHEHYRGLSRQGKMAVYVSPGTGTWGPPVRIGTVPEITLLTLKRAVPMGARTLGA